MTDMSAATNPVDQTTPEALFSAAPWPTVRKALEILGWLTIGLLLFTGLTSIFGRAAFLNEALSQPIPNPSEVFNPFDIRYYEHATATILHLIPALAIFVLGPLQFMRPVRKRFLTFHRWSGRIYIGLGLLAAATGFFLGVFYPFMGIAGQGFNEAMAVAVLSIYVIVALVRAYTSIRARNVGAHREWMMRSFSLMLAVATQRVIVGILMANTDIGIEVLFSVAMWMAIAVNLAATELWIGITRTPGNGACHWKDMDARAAVR